MSANLNIAELVEKRLRDAQQNKKFKDVGRKSGTRKELNALKVVRLHNLEDIEDDPALAIKMVTKKRVWPMVDVEAEKAAGNTAGATFLKYQYHKALAAKPFNSKESRRIYVKVLEVFQDLLSELKTVEEVKEGARQFFSVKTLTEIDENIQPPGLPRWSIERATQKKITQIFGKSFYNLARGGGSTAVIDKVKQAKIYERFTADQERAALERLKEGGKKRNEARRVELKGVRAAKTNTDLYRALKNGWNVTKNYFSGLDFERFQKTWIEKLEKQIEANDNPKLRAEFLARDDDWSWTEAKPSKKAKKSNKPRINSYQYLAHLKRVGGLEVFPRDNKDIKQKYGLAAIQYGNALNDVESAKLTYFLNGAFSDLNELLDIDISKINAAGKLGLDFATRGTAGSAATFWPGFSVINLNKRNGDGSLAHEWGHFIDHAFARTVPEKDFIKVNGQFGAMATESGAKDAEIDAQLTRIMRFILEGSGNERVTITIKPKDHRLRLYPDRNGTMQDAIDRYIKIYPGNFKRGAIRKTLEHFAYKLGVKEYKYTFNPGCSYQYYYSAQIGSAYWVSRAELFARAFEGYVLLMQEVKGMRSDFLQADRSYMEAIFGVYPYPNGEDMKHLAPMFNQLFALVRRKYNAALKPARKDAKRVNLDMENTTLDGDKKLKPSITQQQEKQIEMDKKEQGHKFKPGDMYRSDFDIDGMLNFAASITVKTPVAVLKKLYASMEDMNYHTINRQLDGAIKALTNNDEGKANAYIEYLRELVYAETKGEDRAGALDKARLNLENYGQEQNNMESNSEMIGKVVQLPEDQAGFVAGYKNGQYKVLRIDSDGKKLEGLEIDIKTLGKVLDVKPKPAWFREIGPATLSTKQIMDLIGYKWSVVKPVAYKVDPDNKGLTTILSAHIGKDELRPVMSEIEFLESGATVTDAFTLLHIAGKVPKAKRGMYALNKITKTWNKSKSRTSEERGGPATDGFPNWKSIIPTGNENKLPVDPLALYNYSMLMVKSRFLEGSDVSRVVCKYQDAANKGLNYETAIGFDVKLLAKVCKTMLQLGGNDWHAHFDKPNRAVVFVNHNNTISVNDDSYVLQMPVMMVSDVYNGNIDYGRYTDDYWDFTRNTIISNGSPFSMKDADAKKSEKEPISNWEEKILGKIQTEIAVGRSDAQGMMQAKSFELQQAWTKGLSAAEAFEQYLKPKRTVKPAPKTGKVKRGTAKKAVSRANTTDKKKADAMTKQAVGGKFANLSRSEVLAIAQKYHKARGLRAQIVDEGVDHKKRLAPTPENLVRWMKAPGKYDLIGVDNFKKDDPTANLKISKQIFWNRLGFRK